MMEDEFFESDPDGFHAKKRELLRKGVAQGWLDWDDIRGALPVHLISEAELEVFLFTCESLGVAIRDESTSTSHHS